MPADSSAAIVLRSSARDARYRRIVFSGAWNIAASMVLRIGGII
jgi:hypothetical protein